MSRSLIAFAVVGLALAGAVQAQDNPPKSRLFDVVKSGVLKVGMTGDYMPMTFRDPGSNEFG